MARARTITVTAYRKVPVRSPDDARAFLVNGIECRGLCTRPRRELAQELDVTHLAMHREANARGRGFGRQSAFISFMVPRIVQQASRRVLERDEAVGAGADLDDLPSEYQRPADRAAKLQFGNRTGRFSALVHVELLIRVANPLRALGDTGLAIDTRFVPDPVARMVGGGLPLHVFRNEDEVSAQLSVPPERVRLVEVRDHGSDHPTPAEWAGGKVIRTFRNRTSAPPVRHERIRVTIVCVGRAERGQLTSEAGRKLGTVTATDVAVVPVRIGRALEPDVLLAGSTRWTGPDGRTYRVLGIEQLGATRYKVSVLEIVRTTRRPRRSAKA